MNQTYSFDDLEVMTLPLGALNTNCYILSIPSSGKAVVIDPADSGDFIAEQLVQNELQLEAILLTHAHFDHVLGLLELWLAMGEPPIYLHPEDRFLLKQAQKSAQYWLKRRVDPVPMATARYTEGDLLTLGEHQISVHHTPGHTPGSVSLYLPQIKLLFSGDTLFQGTIGRTDFAYSQHADMQASLKKLGQFPDDVLVLPGHEHSTTIGEEATTIATHTQ